MQRGKEVMVRTTLDQPIVRVLWAEGDGTAIICRKETFRRWEEGGVEPVGIEVPKKDVFEYDGALFEQMKEYDGVLDMMPEELSHLWARAKPIFLLPLPLIGNVRGVIESERGL